MTNEPRTLQLELDEGRVLPVEIRRETRERSVHTGRDLVELHAWAATSDEIAHSWISETLRDTVDRVVHAHDEAGEFAGRWCISWNSYGETGGEHSYGLLLREAEELTLDALLVEEMVLHPYEYREEVVGDGITIRAKIIGTEQDVRRLRTLMRSRQTLSVTRRGIQAEPREMRLCLAEWSQSEDRIKLRIVLVDRGLDASARSELARIEEERNRAAIGYYASFVEQLADLLVQKGALTGDELAALRDGARAAPGVDHHEMWRVADVDEL